MNLNLVEKELLISLVNKKRQELKTEMKELEEEWDKVDESIAEGVISATDYAEEIESNYLDLKDEWMELLIIQQKLEKSAYGE